MGAYVSRETASRSARASVRVATLTCTVAIAACGSTSSKPAASTNSAFALSTCMHTHRVPNFPDPTVGPGGDGFSISQSPGGPLTVDGIAFSGPAFESAIRTCKLFGGGNGPPPISESQKLAALAFARCMRKHRVPNYPDPMFPAGGGIEQGPPAGLGRDSPAVEHAVAACNRS